MDDSVHQMRGELRILRMLVGVSGAAGLGLQIAWMRRLALDLGGETPAVLGVVLAMFAGLAGAGFALGERLRRVRHPARVGILTEAGAAVWAVSTPMILGALGPLAGAMGAGAAVTWMPFAFALVLVGPGAFALGLALPAAERTAIALGMESGRVGLLYSANTLGSAAGAVLTLLVLVPFLGFRASFLVLGACLALVAAVQVRWWNTGARIPEDVPSRPGSRGTAVLLLGTGVLGIGYQMVLFRLLAEAGSGSVLGYACLVLVWLAGTSAGAWHRARRGPPSGSPSGIPMGPMGWLVGGVMVMGPPLILLGGDPGTSDLARRLAANPWLTPLLVLVAALPATFGMGGVLSVLLERASERIGGVGRGLGWNLLGCSMAPVLVGGGLFPRLDAAGLLSVILAGFGMLALAARGWLSGVAGVGIGLLLACGAWRAADGAGGGRILEVRRGVGDVAVAWEWPDGNRTLVVNRRFTMGGTASTNAAIRQAQIPLLLHPEPRSVLFLGLGTGITAASAGWHPGLRIEAVEISPEVAALRRHFTRVVPDPPGWTVTLADARRRVREVAGTFDVVVGDLFHPGRDGTSALFTREHFRSMREALTPGGVACQWIPLYQFDAGSLGGVLRAWESVFPGSQAWWLRWNADVPVLGLMGWSGRAAFDEGWLERRAGRGPLRESLRRVGLGDDFQLFGGWIGPVTGLPQHATGGWIATDDRPLLSVRVPLLVDPEARLHQSQMRSLIGLAAGRGPFVGEDGSRWPERLGAFREARDAYLRGLIADSAGDRVGAETAFLESVRRSPDFPSGYSQILSRAVARAASDPDGARTLLRALVAARPGQPVAAELLRKLGLGSGGE